MSNKKEVAIRPTPLRVNQWNSGDEIIYECPECKAPFGIYGDKERYCHNCGQKINWNVSIKANKYLKNRYHGCKTADEEKRVLRVVNFANSALARNTNLTEPFILDEFDEGTINICEQIISMPEEKLPTSVYFGGDNNDG